MRIFPFSWAAHAPNRSVHGLAALSISALSLLAQGSPSARRKGGGVRAAARIAVGPARRIRRHESDRADAGADRPRAESGVDRFDRDLRLSGRDGRESDDA